MGQPVSVCRYSDPGEIYYGYRVCNNSIAGGVINVFLCVTLLIIDLLIPCVSSGVSSHYVQYIYIYVCM